MSQQQGPVIFNGRYELHRRLGRGGMAEVYLARDQMLDRAVAVKVLFPALATDPGFVERFRREAQRAAGLNHPNIVGVYDWGEANGTYFIVMEYVEGESLAEQIAREGRLHPDRAAEVAADIAAALGFAHRNGGVIHRDIKPGNVLITRDGAVKVADFGIARAISDAPDQNLTKTGSVMGTATYFSPEQARGASVDPRSDIYSLGCVLYEMITGHPPFAGENAVAIAYKHVQEAPVPPRRIDAALPETLEAIILKCLAKNPQNRYPSAQDMRADLRRYLDGARIMAEPVLAPPMDPGATGLMAPTGYMEPTSAAAPTRWDEPYGDNDGYGRYDDYDDSDEDEPKRSKAFLAVLVLLLLILAGLLFLMVRSLGGNGNEDPTTIEMPNVVGQPQADAERILNDAGLQAVVEPGANDQYEVGVVFEQDPPATEEVEEGAQVTIFVSTGVAQVPVPDVVNQPREEAERLLREAGFTLIQVNEEPSDTVEEGSVTRQDPAAAQPLATDQQVTIWIAAGAETVQVPDVVGRPQGEAEQTLRDNNLTPVVQQAPSNDRPAGEVISQDPQPGAEVPEGGNVTITVSSGPSQGQVPDVLGRQEDAARGILENAGFNVDVQEEDVFNPQEDGRVIDQSPDGGQTAEQDSTVTIVIGRFIGDGSTVPPPPGDD
ncbi:MAG: Stk1 family PASTA domain-containing Ser/Thr kinase [Acidimicrobiales bacterium]